MTIAAAVVETVGTAAGADIAITKTAAAEEDGIITKEAVEDIATVGEAGKIGIMEVEKEEEGDMMTGEGEVWEGIAMAGREETEKEGVATPAVVTGEGMQIISEKEVVLVIPQAGLPLS